MKFLLNLVTIILLTGSCNSQKQAATKTKHNLAVQSKQVEQTDKQKAIGDNYQKVFITYDAQTRGFRKYVSMSKNKIRISNNNKSQNMKEYPMPPEDWDVIMGELDKIQLNKLSTLESPSTKRFSDAAVSATLSVAIGDVAYTSSAFDDGNPPKAIEGLVKKILAIAEKVKNQ